MIVAVALALRIGYALNAKWDERLGDAFHYNRLAENILAGKGYLYGSQSELFPKTVRSQRLPLYAFFVAGVYFVSGHSMVAVRVVQAVLGTLTCIFIYFIAKKILNQSVAFCAMIFSAVYPIYIFYTGQLLTESLYLFLGTLLLLCLLSGLDHRREIFWLYAGFLGGLALLCRATILAFLPFMFGAIFWLNRRYRPLRSLGLTLFGIFLVVTPWMVRNYIIHDSWVLSTQAGLDFYMGSNPMNQTGGSIYGIDYIWPEEIKGMNELEADRYLFKKGIAFAKEHPGRYGWLAIQKFLRLWRWTPYWTSGYTQLIYQTVSFVFNAPLILLLIPGMILSRKGKVGVLFLYLFIFSTTLLHMAWNSSMRFQLPMMPYVTIFSSYAFLEGWKRLGHLFWVSEMKRASL